MATPITVPPAEPADAAHRGAATLSVAARRRCDSAGCDMRRVQLCVCPSARCAGLRPPRRAPSSGLAQALLSMTVPSCPGSMPAGPAACRRTGWRNFSIAAERRTEARRAAAASAAELGQVSAALMQFGTRRPASRVLDLCAVLCRRVEGSAGAVSRLASCGPALRETTQLLHMHWCRAGSAAGPEYTGRGARARTTGEPQAQPQQAPRCTPLPAPARRSACPVLGMFGALAPSPPPSTDP